jgi:hypothetical protein
MLHLHSGKSLKNIFWLKFCVSKLGSIFYNGLALIIPLKYSDSAYIQFDYFSPRTELLKRNSKNRIYIMNKRTILYLILATILFVSCGKKSLNIFVSPEGNNNNPATKNRPIQSLEKAFEMVKTKRNKPISIHLLEGDYHLSKPLSISNKLNNVSIIGAGKDKVNIKGSEILNSKWEVFNENIWVTEIKGEIDFNQVFINGEKQILARYPNFDENGGYWQGNAEDAISKVRVSFWKNPVGGFVHAMHSGQWGGFHYEITGFNENGDLTLKGGHQNNRPSLMHPKLRMVENIFEELDSTKEWYFDKNERKLYLWVENGTDLNKAKVEIAILNHLIEIKGTRENPVQNVKIEGIKFEHSKRTFMEEYHQLLRSDWTIYRGGALFLEGTENCSIVDCEFTNIGGNVIFVNGYNRNTEIIGNHIYNCGASAVSFVGDSTAVRSPSYQYNEFVPIEKMDTTHGPANDLYPANCKVENNLIYSIGQVEKQVAGVQISMAMKIQVKYNSIYDVPRAGINISEGTWGGHIIEYNDVFNTVLESGDHGSFNSWGRDRFWHPKWDVIDSLVHLSPEMPFWDAMHTTVIRNNRFRCNHGWDIDLDDGSSNYHIYNNLCLNGGIKLREGFNRVVENNIIINNGFHPHVWFDNSRDVFKKNIVTTKHFPIRLAGWGKEVDFNFFPDSVSLALAQENNTDNNSLYGNPLFVNPEKGDFSVEENSPALKLGFKNFPMDRFGVQKLELKALAKQPEIPELNIMAFQKIRKSTREWLSGTLKNIETPEEQSSFGLFNMDGVIVLNVKKESKLAMSGIKEGDVIIGFDDEKVKTIIDLLNKYQEYLWHGKANLTIIRQQKEMKILIELK